tara:strand:- start:821 stop:1672 length:852 start_codon:yes stop_codon:yes gene_type:complete
MLKRIYHKLPRTLQDYINKAAAKFANNSLDEFIYSDIGKKYNLSKNDKNKIIRRIQNALGKLNSATSIDVQLEIGKKILDLDTNNLNYIVECGCYKGASSVALSIFSKIVDRKLIVYDSFEGLPADNDKVENRNYPHLKLTGKYAEGMYKATRIEVENNLKLFGEYENVIIRDGFFKESLKTHDEKIDLLFLDVDLIVSTQDCLKYLWTHLLNNSYIFTDDACDIDVVSFWFDEKWWRKNLNCDPPGYIGSGCGIPLGGKYSSLGYAIKNPDKNNYKKAFFLN